MFNMPIHKKLQITTTLRFNLTPAGMVKMRKKIKQRKKQNSNSRKKNQHQMTTDASLNVGKRIS